MSYSILHLLLFVSACLGGHCLSSQVVYHDQPVELWRATFNAVGQDNGVYLTTNGDKLVAVSRAAVLRAFDPTNGDVLWTFTPPSLSGGSVSSQSGLTFVESSDTTPTHLAYAVMDTVAGETSTRILTVDLDGQVLWESPSVAGAAAGSPQATRDGRFWALTHNWNQQGYFSLFDTTAANGTEQLLYQYTSELLVFATTTPFSAVGVYHSPMEGFYDSSTNNGRSNTNDIFVFMTDTNTDVVNARGDPQAGNGQMYVFQFPVDYWVSPETSPLAVLPIGSVRNFQARTAPVVTDGGRTLYWNMVRGEVRAWVDDQRWSRGHTASLNLGRGDPPYVAGRASPTVMDEKVYGPGANSLVFAASKDFANVTTVATDGIVSGRVAVTPDHTMVAFGTQSGTLVLTSATDITSLQWSLSGFNPIKGDVAVSDTHIFVGDDQGTGVGQIVALEMGTLVDTPTLAPVVASDPTAVPTVSPTSDNTVTTTSAPSMGEDEVSTAAPSRSSNTTDNTTSSGATATMSGFLAVTNAFFVVSTAWWWTLA